MPLVLEIAHSPTQLAAARTLFLEYAAGLAHDLSFQGFEQEVRELPGEYRPPRGLLLLASNDGEWTGCVAVRPLDDETAELKRLYVRPEGRGRGLGRTLTEAALDHAWAAGFRRIRLDTLPEMHQARALYRSLGFAEISPYRHNPVPGTSFLELEVRQ